MLPLHDLHAICCTSKYFNPLTRTVTEWLNRRHTFPWSTLLRHFLRSVIQRFRYTFSNGVR
ncbi:hypothetical protein DESC_480190 [Desulfosarcina cetonica]|nr:hypothetical protein DESC_480190 [Desulfosarcina cetonica]